MTAEFILSTDAPHSISLTGATANALGGAVNGQWSESNQRYTVAFTKTNAKLLREFLRGRDVEISSKDRKVLAFLADKVENEADLSKFRWSAKLIDLVTEKIAFSSKAKEGKKVRKSYRTEWQLLHHLPLRFIDKSNPQAIDQYTLGDWVVVIGTIINEIQYDRFRDMLKIVVQDINGKRISTTLFRQPWAAKKYHKGDEVILYGNYTEYISNQGRFPQVTGGSVDVITENIDGSLPMIPIYPQREGDKSWQLQNATKKLLSRVVWFEDPVPAHIIKKYDLMTRDQAYRALHFPANREEADQARERLAFDEFIRLQVYFSQRRESMEEAKGRAKGSLELRDRFVTSLPFTFTNAQQRVMHEITENMASPHPMYRLLQGEVGSGKAQDLDSLILTPSGFKRMGDMQVGDSVLTPEGGMSVVQGLYPQGDRPIYELTFQDGTKVRADEEHLWAVSPTAHKNLGRSHKLLRTAELRDDLLLKNGCPKWYVDYPTISKLGSPWSSIIDPYTMGVILGDGRVNGKGARFAVGEDGLDMMNSAKNQDGYNAELEKLGLKGTNPETKFVPPTLLNADEASRLALLQGLLDTDGCVEVGKAYSFSTVSEQLAQDAAYLARSLGGVAKIVLKKRKSGMSWSVTGCLPEPYVPFRLEQKRKRYEAMSASFPAPKAILSIEYIGEKEAQCISLADPKGLYITDGFTITHNTESSTAAALVAVGSGYQVAFLAPTDVLASQLYDRLLRDLDRSHLTLEVNAKTLTGRSKAKERREVTEGLLNGEVNIVVGTHAIIQKGVDFKNLGLVIIDEQHKFGNEQRTVLISNNQSNGVPDFLAMSATPIPRTTSQVVYGDMDVSIIDELPPGRIPVETVWAEDVQEAWDRVREQVDLGHQAYVVTALVEDSETLANVESATATYEMMQGIFPDLNVGLLHGKLDATTKQNVIEKFYSGETQVLVATTVVEVGVNVPNATVMTVLNANRFGIASLHQIRGRVGRGTAASYCYLVGEANNADAEERLNALVASNDGFWLAEKDLEIRGEGSLFGTRQSGMTDNFAANLREHRELLEKAKRVAKAASSSVMLREEVDYLYSQLTINA